MLYQLSYSRLASAFSLPPPKKSHAAMYHGRRCLGACGCRMTLDIGKQLWHVSAKLSPGCISTQARNFGVL